MLLAVMLPTAWVSAQHKVTVVPADNGTITADHTTATEGQTITLTVTPSEHYGLVAGSLVVEKTTDSPDGPGFDIVTQAPRRALGVGSFVSVTAVDRTTYVFTMPETDVEVRAQFVWLEEFNTNIDASEEDSGQPVSGITLGARENGDKQTVTVTSVQMPDGLSQTPLVVYIPATVTTSGGKSYRVTAIAAGTFLGKTNITDIYLPDTDTPLDIEDGAFTLDNDMQGAPHRAAQHIARIHTPLRFLDDYALMTALGDHYQAQHVQATASATLRYWTFSCGVDVALPQGVTLYTVRPATDNKVEVVEQTGATAIKAGNGVLLACTDNRGHSYEMVALPSSEHPTGSLPTTADARSYGDNLLQPVVEATHIDGDSGYYVVSENRFWPVLPEAESVKVPACKAVLYMPGRAVTTTNIGTTDGTETEE